MNRAPAAAVNRRLPRGPLEKRVNFQRPRKANPTGKTRTALVPGECATQGGIVRLVVALAQAHPYEAFLAPNFIGGWQAVVPWQQAHRAITMIGCQTN